MKAINSATINAALSEGGYNTAELVRICEIIDAHTAAAVAAEREACAVIAETDTFGNHEYKGADEIAKEIRARQDK